MTLALRPYQIEGRDFLAARRFALLADEMRVGKTPQAILAARHSGLQIILVVCPAIAVAQWKQEFDRWWPDHELEGAVFDVMSYDKAREHDFSGDTYDVAIIDECHFAKNPQAQRTKAVFGKGGIGWHAKKIWCLSGTPATKHAGELWPMLRAFGTTALSYTDFTRRYCDFDWARRIVGTKQKTIPELKAMLAKIMLRRTRKQVAPEMPDIAFEFLAVDPVSRADLKYVKSTMTDAEIESYIDKQGQGTWDVSDRCEVALAKALPLVEEIAACIERGDYKQTVVFAWHRDAIVAVGAGLRARGISCELLMGGSADGARQWVQREFRDGHIQVIGAQIIAAGTAIDLSAASHGYFLELDWVPGNNVQAANRLVSMDKDEPVTFDICTWPGSVDDRVQRILLRRARELKEMV